MPRRAPPDRPPWSPCFPASSLAHPGRTRAAAPQPKKIADGEWRMERPRGAERGVTLRAVLEPRAGGRFCGRGAFQSAMKGGNMPPSAPTRGGCAAARVEGRRSKVEGWENTWRLRGGQKEASRKGQPGKTAESHLEAKAECRMQNAERAGKAAQSHPQATCKPGTLYCPSIVPRLFLDCSSIVPRLFLDWCSIVPLFVPFFCGGALRRPTAAPPSPGLASTALVCPIFK